MTRVACLGNLAALELPMLLNRGWIVGGAEILPIQPYWEEDSFKLTFLAIAQMPTVVYLSSAEFLRAISFEWDSCSTNADEGAVFLLPGQAGDGGRKFSGAAIYKPTFDFDRYNFQWTAVHVAILALTTA